MIDQVDCVVVGAGVVGLATARELALRGREVVVLEAGPAIGLGTSSRNSEVIHAGIYYPTGSAKARLCVAGKQLLYAYCEHKGIEHRRLGKLIVATDPAEQAVLSRYQIQAAANGVDDLTWLTEREALALEPALSCSAALLSPSSGVVDSHGLMMALAGDVEAAGGLLALRSCLKRGRIKANGFELLIGDDQSPSPLNCNMLVNSAGLDAQRVAGSLQGLAAQHVPGRFLAIGHYYTLSGPAPFSRLVYPLANQGGLGIHLTLDLGGQARFGPDVRWLGEVCYRFDDSCKSEFMAAIKRYYPAITAHSLTPAYTGIRPRLVGAGQPAGDFLLQGPQQHGIRGLVNLFGIESPGLTACLAIARDVADSLAGGP